MQRLRWSLGRREEKRREQVDDVLMAVSDSMYIYTTKQALLPPLRSVNPLPRSPYMILFHRKIYSACNGEETSQVVIVIAVSFRAGWVDDRAETHVTLSKI